MEMNFDELAIAVRLDLIDFRCVEVIRDKIPDSSGLSSKTVSHGFAFLSKNSIIEAHVLYL